MQRFYSILLLVLLAWPHWQPHLRGSAEENLTSIEGSFFYLYYDQDLTSSKQAQQVRQWLEEAWQFFLKQGFRYPQAEDNLIEVYMQGSFLLTNYSRLDTKPYRIYLAVDLGKNPEQKKQEKALVAHEIFHIFQSVYCWPEHKIRQESAWLFEGTALAAAVDFAEDVDVLLTYPYQNKLPFFANSYGAAWFWNYLTKKYHTLTLNEIWETLLQEKSINSQEILESIDNLVRRHTGKSFSILVREFLVGEASISSE